VSTFPWSGYRPSHRASISGLDPISPPMTLRRTKLSRPPLLTQVLAVNALLISATVFTATVLANLNVGEPDLDRRRFLILVAAVMATVLVNAFVLRRRFGPLEQVIDAMETVDFAGRGRAELDEAESQEVERLHQAFDRMLSRIDAERARTATAVLHAQESERARLARDLHDEANQALTGVLLRLEATAQHAPPALAEELRETQGVATQAMEELVRLARELRPAALDDLGLAAVLRTNLDAFARRAGVRCDLVLAPEALDDLGEDDQLVVYRVVQESLSNIARHAGATEVRVEVLRDGEAVVVRVADDGHGFDPTADNDGLGLGGMRERAVLAGGTLTVRSHPGDGTTIELRLGEETA
jgi:two-component system sensor histidine kinase UhpB